MLDWIIILSINTADGLIISSFLTDYLGRISRRRKHLPLIVFVILYDLMYVVLSLLYEYTFSSEIIHTLSIIPPIILGYLYSFIFLKGRPLQKIFPLLIICLLYMFVNFTTVSIGRLLLGLSIYNNISGISEYITIVISKTLLFYLARIIINFKQNDENFLKRKDWFTIILSPTLLVIIMLLFIQLILIAENSTILIFVILIIFLLAMSNIITYYLYINTVKNSRSVLQLEQLKQQQEYEKKYYNDLSKNYDDIKLIRHNIKNQLIYLQAAIKEERNDDATNFINNLTQSVENISNYIKTNNYAVNCILNVMIAKAKEANIRINVQITESINLDIDPADMTIILGNLIENAIEASLKLAENQRQIEISIEYDILGLTIRIINSVGSSVLKNNPNLMTDKPDSKYHGLGIRSVKKLVHKYDGLMLCHEDDGNFMWTIVFKDTRIR